jgi:hypothetical protein
MSRSLVVVVSAALVILSAGPGPEARAGAARQAAGRGQAAIGGTMPYSVGRAMPGTLPGWTRSPQITMFGASSLWEHIDGAAEQYLAFECQDLATAAYTRTAGGTATVEIYRMSDPVHAYGIYAQELSPTATRVAVGVEGRAGKNSLKFWSNEFYVKVVVSPGGGGVPQADVLELGKAVAAGLGAPGTSPAQLAWFTRSSQAGLIADSITFVPADVLGQSMFANAWEAKYAGTPEPSTLVIVPFASADGARGALAKYQSFLSRPGKPAKTLAAPGDGGFTAQEGYYGLIVAVRTGSTLVISLGAESEARATMLVNDAVHRVAASPASPKGKGGSA